MTKYLITFLLFLTSCSENINQPPYNYTQEDNESLPIESFYPVPSESQLEWQESELQMFIHFGINTFTGKEWGDGTEDPQIFNPVNLNAEQWVITAKETGFKYVIFTAKHHDGFCLWPSKYTDYSVKNSKFKNGNGDVVKEVVNACKKHGIKFGFYLSPWDRHEKSYGTKKYNSYFQNQLVELLTQYGTISEVWFDGANGEGPNGKIQEYDWDLYFSIVKHYQPDALISIVGPDIRWIGNENGLAEETEWCIQPRRFSIQTSSGWSNNVWYPSECDVSIRPGWFYHDEEDMLVKSPEVLTDLYFKSVGRNSNLLLNIPPTRDGLFSNADVASLLGLRQQLNSIFANDIFYNQEIESSSTRENYTPENCLDNSKKTFWAAEKNVLSAELILTLDKPEKINIIRLEEAIKYGQRIKAFSLYYYNNGKWEKFYKGSTIGRSRIIKFATIETSKIKIGIEDSFAFPTLREFRGYYSD